MAHRGLLTITPHGQGRFDFTNTDKLIDNRPLLNAYRQRRDTHQEDWHIRHTANNLKQRHTQRLQNLTT